MSEWLTSNVMFQKLNESRYDGDGKCLAFKVKGLSIRLYVSV